MSEDGDWASCQPDTESNEDRSEDAQPFYMEAKTVYVDFSGGLQRAQIDAYTDEPAGEAFSAGAVPEAVGGV